MKFSPAPQPVLPRTLPKASASPDARAEQQKAEQEKVMAQQAARQRHCARLSLKAYSPEVDQTQATDLAKGVLVHTPLNLRAVAEVIDGEAYLAFRGTVGCFGLSTNWLSVNLRSGMVSDPTRHGGFTRAWQALRRDVQAWLQRHQPDTLNITGHSMGAAIAQLAALELRDPWSLGVVTLFATPMVGSAAFNQRYANTPRTAQAEHTDEAVTLGDITLRYLLLSDAIALPLPRLLGYEAGLPIQCIDQRGMPASGVPGLLTQALDQLANPPVPGSAQNPLYSLGLAGPRPDMGPHTFVEEQMGSLRMLAMSQGCAGWAGLTALALFNALMRAIGFHQMERYARALGALPLSLKP